MLRIYRSNYASLARYEEGSVGLANDSSFTLLLRREADGHSKRYAASSFSAPRFMTAFASFVIAESVARSSSSVCCRRLTDFLYPLGSGKRRLASRNHAQGCPLLDPADGIRHRCTATSNRFVGTLCGILRRLVLNLGIQFCSK